MIRICYSEIQTSFLLFLLLFLQIEWDLDIMEELCAIQAYTQGPLDPRKAASSNRRFESNLFWIKDQCNSNLPVMLGAR